MASIQTPHLAVRVLLVLSSELQMAPVQAGQFLIVVEAVLALDGGLEVTSVVAFPLGDHDRLDLAAASGNVSFNDILVDLSILSCTSSKYFEFPTWMW